MKDIFVRCLGPAALLMTLAACSGAGSTLPVSPRSVAPASGSASQSIAHLAASTTAGVQKIVISPGASLNAAPLAPPAGSIYLGARVSPTGSTSPAIVAAFESQMGRRLALNLHYRSWKESFPTADEVDDAANGRVPVDSWNCGVPNAEVISGSQDSVIDARAAAIKTYGKPLFLRYLWEMNLAESANGRRRCYDPKSDLPNGVFSPAQFIAAWRHIRARFASDGVTNVVWLWNPSAGGQNSLAYYPGPSQVDWVGVDTYGFGGGTFSSMLAKMYSQLAPLAKPILIAETGAQSGSQVSFLSGVVPALKASYPLVKGFMYFDAGGPLADWQLSPSGHAAFATLGRDSYLSAFAGRPLPTPPPVATPAPLLPSSGHAYFGASVKPLGGVHSEANTEAFEASIGRTLAIDHHYELWGNLDTPGYTWPDESADIAHGRIPLVNLNCVHYNVAIVAGTYDTEIDNIADNIKAFGHPIFFNYWWEMNLIDTSNSRTGCYDGANDGGGNGDGTIPNYFSHTNYVAAWRRIHDIFVQRGVRNAVWVWDPDSGGQPPTPYYPGDSYVDWLGYDSYASTIGQSFASVNDGPYSRSLKANLTKPIMVAETGVQNTDNQQAWLTSINSTLPSSYPNIKAWVYWDSSANNNYILAGSGLAKLATLGATPFFNTAR